jgi:F-type H+-transporting ATPase subunit b
MKIPGKHRKHPFLQILTTLIIVLTILLAGSAVMAAEAEHGGAKGWVATDTYKVFNFAVLAIGLFLLLRKPVAQALDDRIKGIKEQLEELEARKKDAEDALADYNKKFQMLDQEAERLMEEYIKQGEAAKVKIIEEAKSAAEKLEEQARRNIEHEFSRAKAALKEEVLEHALVKAEEIIKNKISSDDQERLVDEYLEKVVA